MRHTNKEAWSKYKSKNDGRRKFQVDLALAVMEYGITLDWKEPFNDENRSGWMQKKTFVPCACKKIFCKIGKINGIEQKPKYRKEAKRKQDEKMCTLERVDIGKGPNYCKPCYRARMGDTDTAKEKNVDIIICDVKDTMNRCVALIGNHMIINHSYVKNYKIIEIL